MSIFQQLQKNKGTVSSALGKALATKVLQGNIAILTEAIELVVYDLKNEKSKSIRAGAAKIIEKVAEKKPEFVAPQLVKLLPALEVNEPQTRWMAIMTLGYCAKLNPKIATQGIVYAKNYIHEHQGVCLSGAAESFLGNFGAISAENAEQVFPVLLDALDNPLPNETDWILEAFIKIFKNLSSTRKKTVMECAAEQLEAHKPSTRKRAAKIIKMYELTNK